MFHAKQVVPFKTMTLPGSSHKSTIKYYGALAFGCNVSLQCHADSDFTMSMAKIHLKGKAAYELHYDAVFFSVSPLWELRFLCDLAISLSSMLLYHIVCCPDAGKRMKSTALLLTSRHQLLE